MAKKKKKQNRFLKHLKSLGFTNRLSIYALIFLLISIVLGFVLAVLSIKADANFTLAAYTCSVAPIGTFISIAIGKAVDKSKSENLGPDGVGLSFAAAQAKDFIRDSEQYHKSDGEVVNTITSFDSNDEVIEDLVFMPDDEDLSEDTTDLQY